MTAEVWGFFACRARSPPPRSPLHHGKLSHVVSPPHACPRRFLPLSELRHVSRSHADPAPPGSDGDAWGWRSWLKPPEHPSGAASPLLHLLATGSARLRSHGEEQGLSACNLRDDGHVRSYMQSCLDKQKCPRGSPVWCLDAYWGAKGPTLPVWPQPAGAPCPSPKKRFIRATYPAISIPPLRPHARRRSENPAKEKTQTAGGERQQKGPRGRPHHPIPSHPLQSHQQRAGAPAAPQPSPLTRHGALYAPM